MTDWWGGKQPALWACISYKYIALCVAASQKSVAVVDTVTRCFLLFYLHCKSIMIYDTVPMAEGNYQTHNCLFYEGYNFN